MTTTSKFLKSVKNHRESNSETKFSGTLEDYLKLLEVGPGYLCPCTQKAL
jgi:hypothetical protein